MGTSPSSPWIVKGLLRSSFPPLLSVPECSKFACEVSSLLSSLFFICWSYRFDFSARFGVGFADYRGCSDYLMVAQGRTLTTRLNRFGALHMRTARFLKWRNVNHITVSRHGSRDKALQFGQKSLRSMNFTLFLWLLIFDCQIWLCCGSPHALTRYLADSLRRYSWDESVVVWFLSCSLAICHFVLVQFEAWKMVTSILRSRRVLGTYRSGHIYKEFPDISNPYKLDNHIS